MYGILIYPLYTVANIKKMNNLNSALWERIPKNSDDRYHFLEACPPEFDMLTVGLPPFVIDFKKYLTIAPGDLYDQCHNGKTAQRRTRILHPYREHFQTTAAFYLQRVTLPLQHQK
jgi:hypothetical protein